MPIGTASARRPPRPASAAPRPSPGEDTPEDVYLADYKPLITLNRANGGATYFNDGELIAKWSPRDVPETEELKGLLDREPVGLSTDFITGRRIKAQGFALYLLALLLLL